MKTDGIEDLANSLIANHGKKAIEVAIAARHDEKDELRRLMWARVVLKLKEMRDAGLL
jgi:hypothetical protein